MPWLADLVQSSEGSLDVLPVQCLCEFLLHDAADDSFPVEDDEEGESKEQKAKKRQVIYSYFSFSLSQITIRSIWVQNGAPRLILNFLSVFGRDNKSKGSYLYDSRIFCWVLRLTNRQHVKCWITSCVVSAPLKWHLEF